MIPLRAELRNALIECIARLLPDLPIDFGHFLSSRAGEILTAADAVLPDDHKLKPGADASRRVKSKLIEMIDEQPISEFVHAHVSNVLLMSVRSAANDRPEFLKDALPNFDAESLALEVVSALEQLPYKYRCSIPLNPSIGAIMPADSAAVPVTRSIRLARVDEDFWEKHPLTQPASKGTGLTGLGVPVHRPFSPGTVVLQIDVDGFVPLYGSTGTLMDAVLQAKAFLGLCFALEAVSHSYFLSRGEEREGMLIHRMDRRELVSRRPFDHEAASFLRGLELRPFTRSDILLQEIGKALGHPSGQKLRLAARWFFDSVSSEDQLTAFVQMMIVLETLLGEGQPPARAGIGMGELLRNRCAFLLGRTHAERTEILEKFSAMYRVRSAIVHNGHHRLTSSERELLVELQGYCARVIRAEGKLLAADSLDEKGSSEIAPIAI
jgi:hypothetical protein